MASWGWLWDRPRVGVSTCRKISISASPCSLIFAKSASSLRKHFQLNFQAQMARPILTLDPNVRRIGPAKMITLRLILKKTFSTLLFPKGSGSALRELVKNTCLTVCKPYSQLDSVTAWCQALSQQNFSRNYYQRKSERTLVFTRKTVSSTRSAPKKSRISGS